MRNITMWGSSVIDTEGIKEIIDLTYDYVYMFPYLEVTSENEVMLKGILVELNDCEDEYEVEEFLNEKGIKWKCASDHEEPRDILCYFRKTSKDIDNLKNCKSLLIYSWWDGEMRNEDGPSTEVVYDDKNGKSLDDQFDGSNWYYQSKYNHASKYPIITIDGNLVEGQFLIVEYIQYEGSLESGEIVEG